MYLAGDIFDRTGSFDELYVLFAISAMLARAGRNLPATRASAQRRGASGLGLEPALTGRSVAGVTVGRVVTLMTSV